MWCSRFCRRAAPQEVALDYIGKRGSTIGATKDQRVQYARELLQKELLPHIGMEEFCETKKARAAAVAAAAAAAAAAVGRTAGWGLAHISSGTDTLPCFRLEIWATKQPSRRPGRCTMAHVCLGAGCHCCCLPPLLPLLLQAARLVGGAVALPRGRCLPNCWR